MLIDKYLKSLTDEEIRKSANTLIRAYREMFDEQTALQMIRREPFVLEAMRRCITLDEWEV